MWISRQNVHRRVQDPVSLREPSARLADIDRHARAGPRIRPDGEAGVDVLAAAEELHAQDLADLERYGRAGVSPYDTFLASGSEAATRRVLDWLRAHRHELLC